VRVSVTTWLPPVLAADTARVLATTSARNLTVGDFLWFWKRMPPAQRDRPDSSQAIVDWAKSFLAQGLMDAEATRMGYDRTPEVLAQLEARRRIMAVERYYRNAVLAKVDTSDANLETVWKKNPARFHGLPFDRYHGLWYPSEPEARAAARALARGAPWDSLLDSRYAAPGDSQLALIRHSEASLYREPLILQQDRPDSTLRAWFASAHADQVFGPRERAGQWWVYRFLSHEDGKRNTFAEARPVVLKVVLAEEGETRLTAHLAELRRRFGVRVNEAALASLAIPSESPDGTLEKKK
jgi:hypothetical protein